MKLITAIINNSDARELTTAMMKGGFSVTKIGSSGGFLKKKTTTVISAVHNDYLPKALEIIRLSTHGRKYTASSVSGEGAYSVDGEVPTEIVVGGATVLVLNIDEFYKF